MPVPNNHSNVNVFVMQPMGLFVYHVHSQRHSCVGTSNGVEDAFYICQVGTATDYVYLSPTNHCNEQIFLP